MPATSQGLAVLAGVLWASASACDRGTRLELPTTSEAPPATATPTSLPDAPAGDVPRVDPPAGIARVLAEIDPGRIRRDVDRLAGFGTRHTLSATDDPNRGIGAARRWIASQLQDAAGPDPTRARLSVTSEVHRTPADGRRILREVDVVDVVAELPGSMPAAAARRYYAVAHYDSRASDPNDATGDAPGANDDGSGVAVLLELSRVLAARRLDATVVLMATAGEEQGLVGARAHAIAQQRAGADIRGVLNLDIVGDPRMPEGAPRDREIRVFSEGLPASPGDLAVLRTTGGEHDSSSRQLARHVAMLARWHELPVQPMLVFRPDRFARGGDHTPFNELGYAAVRFTELGENYDRQHQDPRIEGDREYGDVPELVDPRYVAGVTALVATSLIHLANAPSSPGAARIVVAELGHTTVLQWDAAPEPDVAGYEVLWRTTTQSLWTHVQDVGDATTIELGAHKDEHFFGVRSYDADGYRSPVVFCGLERRPT
jgi:Zn-dependent M28 family amino/carboxypeptidase